MKNFLRLTLYLLMLTLASNASAWTFNSDALADTLFSDMSSVAGENKDHSSASDDSQSFSASTCNHWCHAGANLLGMTSQLIFFMPRSPEGFSTLHFANPQHFSPENLFRPPRTSLA